MEVLFCYKYVFQICRLSTLCWNFCVISYGLALFYYNSTIILSNSEVKLYLEVSFNFMSVELGAVDIHFSLITIMDGAMNLHKLRNVTVDNTIDMLKAKMVWKCLFKSWNWTVMIPSHWYNNRKYPINHFLYLQSHMECIQPTGWHAVSMPVETAHSEHN